MNTQNTSNRTRSIAGANSGTRYKSTWRFACTLLAIVAVFASSCGSSSGAVAEARAAQTSSSDTTDVAGTTDVETEAAPLPIATPEPPEPTAPPEPAATPEAEEADEPAGDAGNDPELAITGTYGFDFTPLCQFEFFQDPTLEDCETSGDATYLRVLIPGIRTGTLAGTDVAASTFIVSPDGKYVFAGPGKFEGSVEGCGEGTVIYTMYGFGQFESGPYTEVMYTPTETDMGTLAISVESTQTYRGSSQRDVTGTYHCEENAGAPMRPDAGIDADTAREMSGPAIAAFTPLCDVDAPSESELACENDGEHAFQPVLNRVTFTGPFEGTATFFGTQIVASDGFFEHSGMFIFEGTVEGCGEGTVIMVNEAAGRGGSDLSYHRGYTPIGIDSGTLGVRADMTSVQIGAAFEMTGSYSC